MKRCKARIVPWALQWSQPSWDLSLGALGRPYLTLVTVFPHVLLIAVTAFTFSTSLGEGRAWLEEPLAPYPSGNDHFSCQLPCLNSESPSSLGTPPTLVFHLKTTPTPCDPFTGQRNL